MWKLQLLSTLLSQTPLFYRRVSALLDSLFRIQKIPYRKFMCSNVIHKYFLFYKHVTQKLHWLPQAGDDSEQYRTRHHTPEQAHFPYKPQNV